MSCLGRKYSISIGLLACSLFLFSCGGGGSGDSTPIPSDPSSVRLINQTSYGIHEWYVSPSASSVWGDPIWPLGWVLPSGTYIDYVDIPAGYYDSMAIINGIYSIYFSYLYDFYAPEGLRYDLLAIDSGFTGSIEIFNVTGSAFIMELYISPSILSTWGESFISSPIGPGGSTHFYDMPAGLYDVRVVWNIGFPSEYYGINIQSLVLTTFGVY